MVENFDVECSREHLMWNVVDNCDVKCSREWLRGMLQRTVTRNVMENGDVWAQRVIL